MRTHFHFESIRFQGAIDIGISHHSMDSQAKKRKFDENRYNPASNKALPYAAQHAWTNPAGRYKMI
jgi:hypothetical protein